MLLGWFPGAAPAGVVLKPSSFSAAPGDAIRVGLAETGAANAAPAWPAEPAWFFVRLTGSQENRGPADAPAPDGAGTVRVPLPAAGVAMIGLDFTPRTEVWTPAAVTRFAAATGRPDACPSKDAKVEILVSATTLVHIRPAPGAPTPIDTTATSKSGQQVEIRPLMDPTAVPPGADLAVRIYMQGEAAPGVEVRATHVATGTVQRLRADAKAIALIRVTAAGEWRLEADVLRPLTDADAQWRAGSASLTFTTPAALPEAAP